MRRRSRPPATARTCPTPPRRDSSESAIRLKRDAEDAAKLLPDAVLANLDSVAGDLQARLIEMIRSDGDLSCVAAASGQILSRNDWPPGSRGRGDFGTLLVEAFDGALGLLEGPGEVTGQDKELNGRLGRFSTPPSGAARRSGSTAGPQWPC